MQKTIYNHQKSFVYLWYDRLLKKYYLGYYSGVRPNPNYICSSKHMMKEYKARPQDFKRRILQVGQREEMAVLERELLQKRKKHLGERYYNLMIPREKGFPILQYKKHTEEAKAKMRGPRGPQPNMKGRVGWNKGTGTFDRKAYDRQRKIENRLRKLSIV